MPKEYYRIECEGSFEDIQFETLRDNQLNIAGASVPIGVESFYVVNCKMYKIKEDPEKGVEEKEEIGFFNYKIGVDEAKVKTVIEFSGEEALKGLVESFGRW